MPSTARSRPSATASRQSNGPTPLPAYQPALHPLNESGQRALQSLHREHNLESLKRKLQIANNHLTTAAADVNDRLHTQENNYGKYKKRLEKEGSQADDQQDELIAEARQKADEMTGRLEEGVRKIIDSDAEVEGVERALKELQDNVSTGRGRIVPTQSTLGASQFRSNDRRRRGDTQDEGDGDSEFGDDPNRPLGDQENIVGVLKRKVADQKSEYEALSMAQRYAQHNNYIGFKKIVHDAHYPGDSAPPMPHASSWFSSSQDGSTQSNRTRRNGQGKDDNDPIEDDDDELAVKSERVSIKCPITLLVMKDPVTSGKCPHSFEKEAILSMINLSEMRSGGDGRRGGGVKAMKCPVCEVLLTANDLTPNPVLVRKIQRIVAAENGPQEDLSDEDDDVRNPSRRPGQPEAVSSSPFPSRNARTPRLKSERVSQAPTSRQDREVSMVPNSQVPEESQADADEVDNEDEDGED